MNYDAAQNDELDLPEKEIADRLITGRPVPSAGFRGALGRWLTERDPGYGPRPQGLRLMVAGCLGAGAALAAVGLLVGVS
jgi:hypothetical protein